MTDIFVGIIRKYHDEKQTEFYKNVENTDTKTKRDHIFKIFSLSTA
jgi:hypothetical protein